MPGSRSGLAAHGASRARLPGLRVPGVQPCTISTFRPGLVLQIGQVSGSQWMLLSALWGQVPSLGRFPGLRRGQEPDAGPEALSDRTGP